MSDNGMPLKSGLRVTHRANLCLICMLLKSWARGLFLPFIAWVYLRPLLHNKPQKKLY